MQGRPGCWDACGAIAGPQPERLSSGDFLFVYNIDTEAAGKGNDTRPLGRCTVGWAVLNGSNPSQVVARSSTAITTPTKPWDTTGCAANEPGTCQTPNVIFATGLKPLGHDSFLIIYGERVLSLSLSLVSLEIFTSSVALTKLLAGCRRWGHRHGRNQDTR
jgi:predicted GH43/DUF377 family glycosyl hydrolase